MKRIIISVAAVLLGIVAYISVGIALTNAG
jgi:hypothetical protein